MKRISFLVFISLITTVQAQVLERKNGESKENFIIRVLPEGASLEPLMLEHKFNSVGKKIIYFYKKLSKDTSINKTDSIQCIYTGILIPESETSKTYSQQTLLVDCNRDYNCTVEAAEIVNDKKLKNYSLKISFVQMNRISTRLLSKTYKTFLLKQPPGTTTFSIEEEKE